MRWSWVGKEVRGIGGIEWIDIIRRGSRIDIIVRKRGIIIEVVF